MKFGMLTFKELTNDQKEFFGISPKEFQNQTRSVPEPNIPLYVNLYVLLFIEYIFGGRLFQIWRQKFFNRTLNSLQGI